jgi:hypothetical protein
MLIVMASSMLGMWYTLSTIYSRMDRSLAANKGISAVLTDFSQADACLSGQVLDAYATKVAGNWMSIWCAYCFISGK